MVASVALRNEGPGQNIEVRANNYLFWGTNFEDVEHVLETKHVRIIGKIMSIFCRQIHSLFLKRKKKLCEFFVKYFDRLESLESALSAVYSVRSR